MLLPILIFRPKGKKNVKFSAHSTRKTGLIGQIAILIDEFMAQWCYLPVATTPVKTYYLSLETIHNSYPQSDHKSSYVFACSKQKNPQIFGQMSPEEKQELLEQLKEDYRQILINYFITDKTLKEKIDKFINALFYANIPVPQIIEMHMELIDEFSKQLRLEGRSDEPLLDYRLTLIDVLAHLCEVYRCAIAKIN